MKTLKEVRAIASKLDLNGIAWLHADRRFIRAHTTTQWSEARKDAWKAAARAVYPWKRISLYGPRTLITTSPFTDNHAGRNILPVAELEF